MRCPAYPRYKTGGVEWLGDVPEHWKVRRLKMAVELNDKKVEADQEHPVSYVSLENIESWSGRLLPIDPDVVPTGTANAFNSGHTLFGKLRPYLAKACNPDFDGLCSTELLVFKGHGLDRGALLYFLLSDGFVKLVDSSTYGSKMPRANWDFIGSCVAPIAPRAEQRAITAFLDRETGRIDRLVAKKRELIERLKEKRTALISRTVTRGLPPAAARAAGLPENPPLKPSGLDWLDDIPEHWEASRLGFLVSKIGSGKTPKGGAYSYRSEGVMLIRSQNVYDDGLHLDDVVFIDEETDEDMAGSRVRSRDVLLNITGASLGRCAVAPAQLARANVNQHVCVVRPDGQELDPRFAQLSLTARFVKDQIFADEVGSSREGLSFQQVRDLVIAVPPLPEQRVIAAYLDAETTKLEALVAKVERAIERLEEYRRALITAAVTGKIDVRSSVANPPEKGVTSASPSATENHCPKDARPTQQRKSPRHERCFVWSEGIRQRQMTSVRNGPRGRRPSFRCPSVRLAGCQSLPCAGMRWPRRSSCRDFAAGSFAGSGSMLERGGFNRRFSLGPRLRHSNRRSFQIEFFCPHSLVRLICGHGFARDSSGGGQRNGDKGIIAKALALARLRLISSWWPLADFETYTGRIDVRAHSKTATVNP